MAGEIDERDVSALRTLAFATHRFEPFPAAVLSAQSLDRLIRAGWAESGESCRPAVGRTGYRLTPEGWRLARENWTAYAPPLENLVA